ncbi:MAG: hypothetical protein V7655_06415, partial [Aequorivita antarctica]
TGVQVGLGRHPLSTSSLNLFLKIYCPNNGGNYISVSQLMELYKEHPSFQLPLKALYQAKKEKLEQLINPENFSQNGNHTSNTAQ